jgi:small subunit ribosomal protein S4
MLLKAKEKKERALGVKLFLKGERCASPKCAMIRRPYRPGMHGKKRRGALSEFGQQLMEKQRIKASYGLGEAQMRQLFKRAIQKTSGVGQAVINILEKRLDNVVYRLGLAPSRITARQYISHGHFLVNGEKNTFPSFQVKTGDVISIKPESKNLLIFKDLPTTIKKYNPPDWLDLNKEKLEGRVKSLPQTGDISFDINLVVDYYSR